VVGGARRLRRGAATGRGLRRRDHGRGRARAGRGVVLQSNWGHSGDPARPISQAWLKEAAKAWAAEALVSKTGSTVQATLSGVGLFSEHLGNRPDQGNDPTVLGRRHVTL
jgi:hypothetical protein